MHCLVLSCQEHKRLTRCVTTSGLLASTTARLSWPLLQPGSKGMVLQAAQPHPSPCSRACFLCDGKGLQMRELTHCMRGAGLVKEVASLQCEGQGLVSRGGSPSPS